MVKTGKTYFIVWLAASVLPLTFLFAQQVSLTADKTELSVQEKVRLTFTFENIRNAPRSINLDLHDSFSIAGGPYSSSNYSIVNGKTSYKNTVSYDLIAKKTGKIRIPPYAFTIKNEVYRTEPFHIHIRKAPDPQSTDAGKGLPDIFITSSIEKDTVYQGETFTVVYRLFSSKNIVNYTTNPLSTLEGFIVDRFELNQNPSISRETFSGREYLKADIAFLTLTATRTGSLNIPLKVFRISTEREGRSRSFFDDPFFGVSSERENIPAPDDTVEVLPLPPGAGPFFTGAIGDFAMHAELDTGILQENQATRLRVDLIGNGNMEHFTFPKPGFPEGFEVFEPRVKNAYELNKNNYRGSRIWEYVLIPSTPGNFSLDDIRFTYFSPRKKAYKTLSAPLGNIRVFSHDELAGDYDYSPAPGKVRMLSEDIRFIQTEEGKLQNAAYDPVQDPKNWVLYYTALGFVLLFLLAEYMINLRNKNIRKIRYKNALKNAMTEFRKIEADTPHDEFLGHIDTAFRNYLNDKQIGIEHHPGIEDVLKSIETFKYAPGMVSHVHLDKLKEQALNIIEEIEKA